MEFLVKDALEQFSANGKFEGRPYLGVVYEMIPLATAVLNDIPQGAYVVEVVGGSPADNIGVKPDDIITKLDGKPLKGQQDLAEIIKKKKVGDKIELEIYSDGQILNIPTNLTELSQ